MSAITTHILDTARGQPARGVTVTLDVWSDGGGGWQTLGGGTTDNDGRLGTLLPAAHELWPGAYRLIFHTGNYFAAEARDAFYPQVTVEFQIKETAQHYHVPLLLNPFGYSTYRGS